MDRHDPRAQALLHATALRALERALERFAAAGIAALPVKGIVTAYQLYREPWERPIADIDLRIVPADLERARAVARDAGWPELAWAPAYDNLVVEVAGIMVDVEGTIGPPGLCALSVEKMLARAVPSSAGHAHVVPELHDHALLLCVNAFKDKLTLAAPWSVEDLVRIVRQPGFAPETLARRAREARVVALAWIVADWLATAKGAARWAEVRERLSPRPPRARYQRALGWALARAPEGYAARVLTRVAADDPRAWLGALARAAAWQARVLVRGRRG